MDQNQGRAIRRISLAGRLWGVLGESVRSRNRRYLHQKPGKAPSEDDISRRIPALSGTPSGGLRRALCLGLRFVPALQAGNRFLIHHPGRWPGLNDHAPLALRKNGQTHRRRLCRPPVYPQALGTRASTTKSNALPETLKGTMGSSSPHQHCHHFGNPALFRHAVPAWGLRREGGFPTKIRHGLPSPAAC